MTKSEGQPIELSERNEWSDSEALGFCSIDGSGALFDGNKTPIVDSSEIEEFFKHLHVEPSFQVRSCLQGQPVIVEAFDAPIVVHAIELRGEHCELFGVTGYRWTLPNPLFFQNLLLDEWDRFQGVTREGVPFVLTPQAQDQFFDQLDEFSDEILTFNRQTYTVGPYWITGVPVESAGFWDERYRSHDTGWDLGEAALPLRSLLPKLKLPVQRVLVLGGGGGHDAAYFAEQGHHVTLVDISQEAIERAQARYGHISTLRFLNADLFELPHSMEEQFDLIFEHTCFCAIAPARRDDLVRQWRRLLSETGHLLALFFVMPKRMGPPYGASEWEIQRRLEKSFQALIWQRCRHSIAPRMGRELLLYGRKK